MKLKMINFDVVTRLFLVSSVSLVVAIVFVSNNVRPVSASEAHQINLQQDYYPPTGFGGYRLNAVVHEISGEWHVPNIETASPYGEASTWIGVQTANGAFIQLGVTEDQTEKGVPYYEAFWSDTPKHFQPQLLGIVKSGQSIHASMTQSRRGWTVNLVDASQRIPYLKRVSYGGHTSFTTGEWLQENPPASLSDPADSPYPIMSVPNFTNLTLNDTSPHLDLADAQVLMPSNRPIQVPTKVLNDSFTFVRPAGADLKYLNNARLLDSANSGFDYELSLWSDLSKKRQTAAIQAFINALIRMNRNLESGVWPDAARMPIKGLVEDLHSQAADLKEWLTTDLSMDNAAFERFNGHVRSESKFADTTRATLGLPPT